MALSAMIFDVDGTLVDSNWLHVEAFREVFAGFGYCVAPDRIFKEIGKGGDHLVPDLLGEEADQKHGDDIRAAQPEAYRKIAERQGIRVFPGAVELIRALRDRAIQTVLATSSAKTQLQLTEKCGGVEWSKLVDAVVTADDAATSKPAPDLVAAAAARMSLSPAQCAMLGDTPFDAASCRHAGVVCLGLTSGGHSAEELISCGARAVWKDTADVLRDLDEALKLASPGPIPLTQNILERLMREALQAAQDGAKDGEVPIGALIARGDGAVIARGWNRLNHTGDKTAHAEMVAFAAGAGKIPLDARDLVLVSTLEPCVMCTGAAMVSGIDTIVYGLKAPADSGSGRVRAPTSPDSQMPRIVGNILAAESRRLFEKWLATHAQTQQAAYVQQLLELNKSA